MKHTPWLWPAVGLLCVSCASTPAPAPRQPLPPSASSVERDDFRVELEEARAAIVSRENDPSTAKQVDFEAAASIPIPEHKSIDGALRYFSTTLRDKIQTSLLRSARYRAMIDEVLEQHRLPRALAYLPIIESAYIPTLTSRAGAHGIWQFMPETARDYGLRIDWWVDERADPELSTRAAAEFLSDLYREFEDWPLALAAYNCGPGRVRRALSRTGASTFWELLEMSALPKETRGYVPTFYATLRIAGDPEAHGFSLQPPTDRSAAVVEIDGPVSFRHLAEAASLDEEELRLLNPSLHRGLVPPGHTAVKVPAAAASVVAAMASHLHQDDEQITVASFTVRRGDTVTKLAGKLGTTPATIRDMNGLRPTDALRAGRSIYLPVNARRLGALLRHAEDRDVFYTVAKGDTLYAIAKKHKLSVVDLRELNDLSKDAVLKVGQKLRVTPPRGVTAGGM